MMKKEASVKKNIRMPEILAPAGDMASLTAAIDAGADAVYFGIKGPNMRAKSDNFTIDNLKDVVDHCHKNKVKAYLAVNSLIFEWDRKKIDEIVKAAKECGVDAVICWDLGVIKKTRELGIDVHLSTQASVANSESAKLYKELGVKRIVLARECSLEQIKEIRERAGIEVEVFIHGAMCTAISGRCFLSQFTDGKSANRGACIQNCRREYIITDEEGNQFQLGNDYILSAKDLCTMPFIEKLIEAEIDSFKIEGRKKHPEYVSNVVRAYREAVDLYFENIKNKGEYKDKEDFLKMFKEKKKELMKPLEKVFNRGFSSGFFLGKPVNEFTDRYGNSSKYHKIQIGKVINFYSKLSVAEVLIEAGSINIGEDIFIIGPTTGVMEFKVDSMQVEGRRVDSVEKNNSVGINVPSKVRKNDKVYKWNKR